MLVVLLCVCVACIAFVGGTVTSAVIFYPQLVLLRSMLIDKHQAENIKKGIKQSAVSQIPQPTAEQIAQDATAHHSIIPPDIFKRREAAENDEREALKRQNALLGLISNMP